MSADIFLGKDMGLITPVYNERLQLTQARGLIALTGIVVMGGGQILASLDTRYPEKTTFSVSNAILDDMYSITYSRGPAPDIKRGVRKTDFILRGQGSTIELTPLPNAETPDIKERYRIKIIRTEI